MARKTMYGQPKKVTSVSMPAGLYEFFRRYHGRENNASGGISLAISVLVKKDLGARCLMVLVVAEGYVIPDDLVVIVPGWETNEMGLARSQELRRMGIAYDAEWKKIASTAQPEKSETGENLPGRIGAPLLFEQMMDKYMVSLTQGEIAFLDKLGTGKRPRSQGIRFLAEHLWLLDRAAAQIICDIAKAGSHFVPQVFLEIAEC